jgi:hypothetical protein
MYTYTHTCIFDLLRRVTWSTRCTRPLLKSTDAYNALCGGRKGGRKGGREAHIRTHIHTCALAHMRTTATQTHTTHTHAHLAIAGDEARGASGHARPVVVNND